MKQILSVSLAMLLVNSISAQVIRDHRNQPKPKTIPTTIKPGDAVISGPRVVLYDQPGFSGASKSFGIGDYRFTGPADFNDLASSVKIPDGLVAVIYEHANESTGYGNYIDLLEDCKDLSVYGFNDKTSFLRVFSAVKPGFIYVRNRISNNQFVAGHWERERADGKKPDNSLPAVASSLSQSGSPDDYTYAPAATQAEIDEINDVLNNQLGVGVLGGETTRPFYYHHNQPGEEVYKYKKVIDPARLPGKFFDWASQKLGRAGIIVKPFEVITDVAGDIKDWIFGSGSTKMEMDCWYPVSEYKKTVCGKMDEDVEICTQDYSHTQVTVDKDVCYVLVPSERFRPMLTNRWTGETHEKIEGEVKTVNLANFNTQTQKSVETTTPRNPLLMQIKKDEQVCFYGPWMGDILDINVKIPVPLTDASLDLGNINLRNSNEIHPINQFWRQNGKETQLIAVADGTGYFQKTGNGEITASGLYQRMRFYKAFLIPANQIKGISATREFTVNGVGFEFTDNPVLDIQSEILTLKYKGSIRLTVNDNSVLKNQKTHKVFFDNVRTRADGSLQGYIVVETEPINKKGGSINIFIRDETRSPLFDRDRLPVRTMQ